MPKLRQRRWEVFDEAADAVPGSWRPEAELPEDVRARYFGEGLEEDNLVLEYLAWKLVANGGGLVVGIAGVGKTKLVSLAREFMKVMLPRARVVATAPTHAAATQLPDGATNSHVLSQRCKATVAHDCWFFLDEIGMMQVEALGRFARFGLVGGSFILSGDFVGQFDPINDSYLDDRYDRENSELVFWMAKGLKIKLGRYRRGKDERLFRTYAALYAHVREPVQVVLEELRRRYPPVELERPQDARHLCKSNRFRMVKNRQMNELAAKEHADAEFVVYQGLAPLRQDIRPQSAWIYVGQLWMGCTHDSRKIRNQCLYRLVEKNPEAVVVERLRKGRAEDAREGERTSLGREELLENLRLTHATTYYSAQSQTLEDQHVCLHNLDRSVTTMRDLIVGMSRATEGRYVHLM